MQLHNHRKEADKKINPKEDDAMQRHMQAGNITTNINVQIDFILPELSATKIVTWNCHMNYSATGRYDMVLGRDILTA